MTCDRKYGEPSPFEEWCRSNPRLDSKIHGVTCCDVDHNWHVYKLFGSRVYQGFMEIEGKSGNAIMSHAQHDTLRIKSKFLGKGTLKVFSKVIEVLEPDTSPMVWVHHFGLHLLHFSGKDPGCSDELWWNHKRVDMDTLEKILRLEIHPKTLEPVTIQWYKSQIPRGITGVPEIGSPARSGAL